MSDINIKEVSPDLMKKYKTFKKEIKANHLTTKLVINNLLEQLIDDQIKNGYPIIKKINKQF